MNNPGPNADLMKQIITLFAAALLSSHSSAQFVMLHDTQGNMVNNQTVVHWGSVSDALMTVHLETILVNGPQRPVNMRRYEMGVDAGTENYFCWGVCYGPQLAGDMPEWSAAAQHAVTLTPNTPVSNFSGYHVPNGIAGTSTYRFVWYDVGNPTDTAWVDIQFRTTGVGMDEANDTVVAFGLYPNPSTGSDVQLQLEVNGAVNELSLSVYNMLGERVQAHPIRANTNRILLPAAQLTSGVYFASLERAGAAVATKRFVVTAR
ncbi:MAG: T9SS type A sorting domain-containing protein [Flavobacteriales bacterium]|jgi:hypothetical protein|nr:T9SS type A sorting domain-containing protein [Flavobacteriales bacterium]MBK7083901.1 T9SS type A sorting domain-containing protein [Flavobacteriales bacterium]MBK7269676.1 T9SS type A sorting domain-containing protein [Flavobacteriales bacterium]MBK7754443.1 T9SS type A sorting domain-containing protein [Flavobacteriales bacterium]MBK9076819.1 T9SS type A sorting domain-containing protein [Flavobacteriales bacterium]